jgi:hypothetical protein
MSDQIEILKTDNDPSILSPLKRKPRQGWSEARVGEVTQGLPDTRVNILSPGESSSAGDVCNYN